MRLNGRLNGRLNAGLNGVRLLNVRLKCQAE